MAIKTSNIQLPGLQLGATVCVPVSPRGIIVFAHGSGSSRFGPRNIAVADELNQAGFATLLLDLLTPSEETDRRNVFDILLLADRLVFAVEWIDRQPELAYLPLGFLARAQARRPRLSRQLGCKDASVPSSLVADGRISLGRRSLP